MKSIFAIIGLFSLLAFTMQAHADEAASAGTSSGVLVVTATGTTLPGGMVHVFTSTANLSPSEIKGKAKAHSGKIIVKPKADDATDANGSDAKGSDVKVEAFSVGKVIEMGPDGKVEVKDFNSAMPPEMMKNMPQELRDAMEKLRAQTEKLHALKGAANGIAAQPMVRGKMKIVVEKDGKRSEYESDLGDPQADNAQQVMPVPPEAMKALESVRKAMQTPAHAADHKASDLGAKLDKILDRLDRIEADVKSLKDHDSKGHEDK